MSDIQSEIIKYIYANASHEISEIGVSTNFAEDGLLDSFAILNLIMTLEAEYEIKFQPHELADPALRTVGALTQCVVEKMK
ncbi:acyl carrier protein [Magnetovibrio sp. PR-2]|uniref:acyl carrier protein n=1 Tax=Magnetovibrio sp. PR-2 TaxID=3120356 RepID=UPI002FCDEF81